MTTPEHVARADRATAFLRFADTELRPGQLYDALCRIAAGEPALLELLSVAPPEQRRPNLWLAAIHDRILGGDGHPLADYFESAGGSRPADAALRGILLDFCATRGAALLECIATRTTQTNEIGRCAILWPVLRWLAQRTGRTRIGLLDFGCSAGLNLGVDRYRYDYGDFTLGAEASIATPCIECRFVGERRAPQAGAAPQIAERLGVDPAPIDIDDERAVRWLQACLWPHDTRRRLRLDQAVALARRSGWPVREESDCMAATERWVAHLAPDVLPVVFNSWVLTYLPRPALDSHLARMRAQVQRGAAWISAEAPPLRIGAIEAPPLPLDAPPEHRAGTLWTVCLGDAARPAIRVLARSHPHGHWVEWLDPPPT
jgi:hypothetical protein